MSLPSYFVACPECRGSGSTDEGSCSWCDSTGTARCEARNRWTGFRLIACPQDAAVVAEDGRPMCLDCLEEKGLTAKEESDVIAA